MSTVQRYPTTTDEEREAAVEAASLAIQRGGLVVLPTDTVYGLAADAFDKDSVRELLEAKGRGRDMPPPVLVSAATTLDALAVRVPTWARALVEEFWPGALTLVCHAHASLQWDLGDTRGTVAVRMPDHPVALEILERTGPLAVSSANLTGRPAATEAAEAEEMLGEDVEVVVDAGTSPGGAASTIVDATATPGRVLRLGAISLDQINGVLEPLGHAIPDPDAPVKVAEDNDAGDDDAGDDDAGDDDAGDDDAGDDDAGDDDAGDDDAEDDDAEDDDAEDDDAEDDDAEDDDAEDNDAEDDDAEDDDAEDNDAEDDDAEDDDAEDNDE